MNSSSGHSPAGTRRKWWRFRDRTTDASPSSAVNTDPVAVDRKPVVVYIIRHAHAGNRSNWSGPDHKRPISHKGVLQSKALADYLTENGARQILTSPSLRCIQTVAPLAHALNLEYVDLPELAEGAPLEGAVSLLRTAEKGTVICSHGDVLANLVGHLAAHGAPIDPKTEIQKASVWRLTLKDGQVKKAKYIPPPKV